MAGKLEYLLSIVPELDKKKYAQLKKDIEAYEGGNLVTFTPDEARKLKGLLSGVIDDVGEKASGLGAKIAQGVRDGLSKADLESALGVDIEKLKETVDVVNKLSDMLTKLSGSDSWMKSSEGFVKSLSNAKQQIEGFQTALQPIGSSFEAVGQSIAKMHENIGQITKDIKDLQDTILKTQGTGQNIGPTFANTEIQEYIDELQELEKTLQQISSNSYEFKFVKDKSGQKKKLEKIVQEYKSAKNELENLDPDGEMSARDFAMESARQYDVIITSLKQIQILKQEIEKSSKGSVFKESVKIDFDVDAALKEMISKAKLSYTETLKTLQEELNGDSGNKISSNTNIAIGLTVPTEKEIVSKINKTIDRINGKGSIHSININVDDAANFIEDKKKRGYKNKNGEKPASDDANTDELVKKTEDRFDRIGTTIENKQNKILEQTQKWRQEIIKAMTISAKDLEFEFGWQNSVVTGATNLQNELQQYFNDNPIDVRINTESLAKQVASVIEANGITIGGSGGAASIDPKALAAAVAAGVNAAFYGGGAENTSILSESMPSLENGIEGVTDETEDATEVTSEYVKVLSESSTGVSTLIKSLRALAKLTNKEKPSKAAQAMYNLLLGDGKGIDLKKITEDTSPSEIVELIQNSLFAKDSTGMARGTDLADTIRSNLSKMPKGNAVNLGKILANNVEDLFRLQDVGVEFESEKNIRLNNINAFKELLPTLQLLDYLGTVRSTKYKTNLPSVKTIDEAIAFFGSQGRSIKELEKLKESSAKFEADSTEENKKEFEAAANTFFENTRLLFSELNEKALGFKGKVYLKDGKGTRIYDKRGAYPRGIRYISADDIQDVDIYEIAKGIDVGAVGSTDRKDASKRKARSIASRVTLTDRPVYISAREKPNTDVRYQDVEYKPFKIYEKEPDKNELLRLPLLEESANTIIGLKSKLDTITSTISELEKINEELGIDVESIKINGNKKVDLSNINSIVNTINNLTLGLRLLDEPIDSRTIENLGKLNISEVNSKLLGDISSKMEELKNLNTKISAINSAGSVEKLIESAKKNMQGAEALKLVQSFQNVDFKKNIPSIANIDSLIGYLPLIGEDNTVFQDMLDQIAQALNPNKFKELETKRKELSTLKTDSPQWVATKNEIKEITDYIFRGFTVLVNRRNELSNALLTLDKESPEYSSSSANLKEVNKKLNPILKQLAPIFNNKSSSINSIVERLTSLYGNVNISEMQSIIKEYKDTDLSKLISQRDQMDSSLKSMIEQLRGILSKAFGKKNEEKVKEIELLVSQIKRIREELYAEADGYVTILSNKNIDENTKKYTTAKLQQVLSNIHNINTSASRIQELTDGNILEENKTTNRVDKWAAENYDLKYLDSLLESIRKLREERSKGVRPNDEIDAEIRKIDEEIAAFRAKNIVSNIQGQVSLNERELRDARKEETKIKQDLAIAQRDEREANAIKSNLTFTSEYIGLLEREKKLLEEIAELEKSGKTKNADIISSKKTELNGVQGRIEDLLSSTNTPERTKYAREQALAYQDKLRTVRMQKSKFTRDIAQVESDEKEFEKYGLTAGAGLQEFNNYKRILKRNFRQSEGYQDVRKAKIDTILSKIDFGDSKIGGILGRPIQDKLIAARKRVIEERNRLAAEYMQTDEFKKLSDEKQNEYLGISMRLMVKEIEAEQKELIKEYISKKKGQEKSKLEEWYQKVNESFQTYKTKLWDQFDAEMKDMANQFSDSLKIEDGKLMGKSFIKNDDGTWSEVVTVIDENIEKTIKDRLRLAERKAVAEAGLAPLQAKETDLIEQKRLAMRYGGLTKEDLANNGVLSKIENKQESLTSLNNEITRLLSEKEQIENSKKDEDTKKSELAKLNKQIKEKTQEASYLEEQIDNYKRKIDEDNATRAEGKTDEAKLARAQNKLERYNKSLERAEANVNKWKKSMEEATDVASKNQAELNYENAVKARNGILESIRRKKEQISGYEQRATEKALEGSSGKTSTQGGIIGLLTNSVVEGVREALSGISGISGDNLATESTLRIIADALTGGNLSAEWMSQPHESPKPPVSNGNKVNAPVQETKKELIKLTGKGLDIFNEAQANAKNITLKGKNLSEQLENAKTVLSNMAKNLGQAGTDDYVKAQYNLNVAIQTYAKLLKDAGYTRGFMGLVADAGIKKSDYIGYKKLAAYQFGNQGGLARGSGTEKEIEEISSYIQLLKDAFKGLDGRSSGKTQAEFFAGLSNEVKEAGFLLGDQYRDVLSDGDLKILQKYDKARENWAKYEPEITAEKEKQTAEEKKQTIETEKQKENKTQTSASRKDLVQQKMEEIWGKIPQYDINKDTFDTARQKAIELKSELDKLYDEGNADTEEFIQKQTELSQILSKMRGYLAKNGMPDLYATDAEKAKKDYKSAANRWKDYLLNNGFANLDNVSLGNIGKTELQSIVKQKLFPKDKSSKSKAFDPETPEVEETFKQTWQIMVKNFLDTITAETKNKKNDFNQLLSSFKDLPNIQKVFNTLKESMPLIASATGEERSTLIESVSKEFVSILPKLVNYNRLNNVDKLVGEKVPLDSNSYIGIVKQILQFISDTRRGLLGLDVKQKTSASASTSTAEKQDIKSFAEFKTQAQALKDKIINAKDGSEELRKAQEEFIALLKNWAQSEASGLKSGMTAKQWTEYLTSGNTKIFDSIDSKILLTQRALQRAYNKNTQPISNVGQRSTPSKDVSDNNPPGNNGGSTPPSGSNNPPQSGSAPVGGILGILNDLARENTLHGINSNIGIINTSLGTANTTLGNMLAKLAEIAKHNAMSGQRNSALDLLTRLQNTLKFSYDTNKEYLGYMNLENGILTDFFSGDESTISKEMLASLREAYGNIALDAQIHTHGQTNKLEDAFFSSKELTGQFAQDFADGIKKQILLSNEGITVLDLSDVDPTKVETTLKAISDAGPSMEKILAATKDTGARYLSQKFDNLTPQAFVKMLGIKGVESKLTQAQTEEMATQAIAENEAKESAKIIQESTGKAILTTAERFGAEMRTITEKTDVKGNKTWSVTTSNDYTKAAQAANRGFTSKGLENVFGKGTKAYKALNEYKKLYESLFGDGGLVTAFNTSKDNQTPELQAQIDALIPKLEKAESKLKSLIYQQEKFANRDNIVATLSQGKMRNKRNNLEKIAKEQLLGAGIENFATAGMVGTNNGQSLMVDTLKNGYITRYAFELDEATGQVRMMEQAQTALVNAFQNVNKVMKQNEIVRANITMTDDVKNQEAYLAQLKSPVWDEYSSKLKELQKLVSHVWSKKTGPSKEEEARIMALSERIIALGRDIQKTSNDFKNMMSYIPDEDIISINRGKNAGSTRDQLENWAKERARASQSQYEFVGFDNKQLVYKMVALDGAITKCTIAYSDMYNMAGVVEEKQIDSVDKTVAKIQQYEEAIKTAKEMRYLDKNDSNAQKFADILVKIKSIINDSNLSLEEQQKQIEILRQEALRYGEATKKTIGQNIKSFSGINEINSATRQFNKLQGTFGFERGENPEILDVYIKAYDTLIEKFKKYSDAKIANPSVQEELRKEAAYVQSLGRAYNKSATEASKLTEYVEQSKDLNFVNRQGQMVQFGGQTEVNNMENLRSQMENYAKVLGHANMENVKYNATKREMTFVTRLNNEQVADMVVKYNDATHTISLYNKQQRESLSGLKLIGAEFKKKVGQILQYTASITSIYRVWGMLRQGITYIKEIDTALTELKKVTDETEATYDKFLKTASKTAGVVGSTIKDVVSSTADWARLGYSLEQAAKLAETTSILLNVSEFQSIDQATSALVSTMQAFGYAAEDSMRVVDVMNEIGNNYAISSDGIATALQDSASSLMAANNSYQEAVALVASANKVVDFVPPIRSNMDIKSSSKRGNS